MLAHDARQRQHVSVRGRVSIPETGIIVVILGRPKAGLKAGLTAGRWPAYRPAVGRPLAVGKPEGMVGPAGGIG